MVVTAKVAVIFLLSSRSLMGTFFTPSIKKAHFPVKAYKRGCLVKVKNKFCIMIQYGTGNVSLKKVIFFPSNNFLEGSNFPVLLFRLVQFMDFKTIQR